MHIFFFSFNEKVALVRRLENPRLKMGREADSYETTNRAELYGSHLPLRRSPSAPTVRRGWVPFRAG